MPTPCDATLPDKDLIMMLLKQNTELIDLLKYGNNTILLEQFA
ncbi:MAG: hypothetical protein ACOVRN_15210 [Flavobacterium sp.]